MRSNSRGDDGSRWSPDDSPQNGSCAGTAAVSARHLPLSDAWKARVGALEAAINDLKPDGRWMNKCEVVFFEVPGDECLHVNVTHRHATKAMSGWAGPGRIPDGYVHSRTFGDMPKSEIMRHIRDVVYAARAKNVTVGLRRV